MDWLDAANGAVKANNLKCNVLKGGAFNWDVATLTTSSLTAMAIGLYQTTDRLVSNKDYELKCLGALAPTTDVGTSNKITVTYDIMSTPV